VKAAIIPGFSELLIFINPSKEVTRVGLPFIIMPWLYAPWPEARKKGIVHINVLGETLRMLLEELSQRYKQTDVDFDPLDLQTNGLDNDYEVLVNEKNYISLPDGLDEKLKVNDEVKVKMLWRWDG
jgi:molybdopterin converting factor small subunit